MDGPDDRIPVTLLTGFLGAGKTTLLNHLIRDPGAGQIAVIINEFGDIGLDHDLVEESTEEMILLPSGCLCCSVRADLLKVLGKLIARRSRGELAFDRVVIETTGVADPGPVLHSLMVDRVVAPHFRIDGLVTVADAATGQNTLRTQPEAVNQIAMADLIVLSKTDLVTPSELSHFEARLAEINGTARRISAKQGRVPAGMLFGLTAMRKSVTESDVTNWLGGASPEPDLLANLSGFKAPKPQASMLPAPTASRIPTSGHGVRSASIEVHHPIPASVFDFWLEVLIALKGQNILRMKGIVHVEGVDFPFVFHGVQHIFEPPVPLESWTGEENTSRVVIIARNMSEEDLAASLETLNATPNENSEQAKDMMGETAEMPF